MPHEATIGLPVLLTLLALTQSEKSVISTGEAAAIVVAATFFSGAWLGFAWDGLRLFPLILRPLMIAALIVAGYAVGKHPPLPEGDSYGHTLGPLYQSILIFFMNGWMMGNMVREVIITLYISQERRRAFDDRTAKIRYVIALFRHPIAWLTYWTHLSVGREDRESATTFDLLMARFIGDLLTPRGMSYVVLGVVAVAAAIRSRHVLPW